METRVGAAGNPQCGRAAVPDQAAVLTKATLRAATQLGLTNKLLVTVIGVSEATVSRMRSGDYALQRGQKSFELAVLFVRLHVASVGPDVRPGRTSQIRGGAKPAPGAHAGPGKK